MLAGLDEDALGGVEVARYVGQHRVGEHGAIHQMVEADSG